MPTALLHFVAAAAALALWQRGIPADQSALQGWVVVDKTGSSSKPPSPSAAPSRRSLAGGYLAEHKLDRGEYYPLLTFASAGAMLLAASNDMLMLFIALETMSLGVYAMTGFRRTSRARPRRRSSTSSSAPSPRRCCSSAPRCSTP
jgi:NADH-quinone oxidoreductase subunit N